MNENDILLIMCNANFTVQMLLILGFKDNSFSAFFCVASTHLKQSNECESSHFKSKNETSIDFFDISTLGSKTDFLSTFQATNLASGKVGSKVDFMKCGEV